MSDNPYAIRDRGYDVRRSVPPGTRVRFARSTYNGGEIAAGETGVVESYSNVGFNGIAACVLLDSGRRAYSVNAGHLEPEA